MFDKLAALFSNEPNMLVEYLFVDDNRLTSYAEQLHATTVNTQSGGLKLGWSATGPSISAEGSSGKRVTNNPERIHKLLKFLEKKDMIHPSRPENEEDSEKYSNHFFIEQCKATKLILKVPDSIKEYGLRDLAVWLSSPLNKPSSASPFKAEGVFLYLIESYWKSDKEAEGPVSGHSALKILLEECAEKYNINLDSIRNKLSFREDDTLPMTLFSQAGFLVQSPRTITTLYRQRYLSDDKHVNFGNVPYRCYDLFAYPIFIASGAVSL